MKRLFFNAVFIGIFFLLPGILNHANKAYADVSSHGCQTCQTTENCIGYGLNGSSCWTTEACYDDSNKCYYGGSCVGGVCSLPTPQPTAPVSPLPTDSPKTCLYDCIPGTTCINGACVATTTTPTEIQCPVVTPPTCPTGNIIADTITSSGCHVPVCMAAPTTTPTASPTPPIGTIIIDHDFTQFGKTVHVHAEFPHAGGSITGMLSNACTGIITGTYSGDASSGRTVNGVISSIVCGGTQLSDISFSGSMNSTDSALTLTYTTQINGIQKTGTITIAPLSGTFNCSSSIDRPDLCTCSTIAQNPLPNQCSNICTADSRGNSSHCCPNGNFYCSTLGACVTSTALCPATGSTLALSVSLPGIGTHIGDNQSPIHSAIDVTLQTLGSQGSTLTPATQGKLVFDGNNYMGSVPVGTLADSTPFYVTVKAPNSLSKRSSGILSYKSNSSLAVPAFSLIAGDILPDNILNIFDYNAFVSCYQAQLVTGNLGACQNADLNDDGLVDEVDLSILLRSFANVSGDESINSPILCTINSDCGNGQMCALDPASGQPLCQGTPSPTPNPSPILSQEITPQTTPMHCGGNTTNPQQCPSGFTCVLNPQLPDTGGTCVVNQTACNTDANCPSGQACITMLDQPYATTHCAVKASVTSISPTSASYGTLITITGSGFSTATQNTINFDGSGDIYANASSDGTTLTFTLPSTLTGGCIIQPGAKPDQVMCQALTHIPLATGEHVITVITGDFQTTNSITFSVIGTAQSGKTVNIQNLTYSPAALTVNTGDTVIWTNNDQVIHTVTSDNSSFNSGDINPGSTFSYSFTSPGKYQYACMHHPQMTGIITVVDASGHGNSGMSCTADTDCISGLHCYPTCGFVSETAECQDKICASAPPN